MNPVSKFELDLRKLESDIQRRIEDVKKEYSQQLRELISSIEGQERSSEDKLRKMTNQVEKLEERIKKLERELEATIKKVELVNQTTLDVKKGLNEIKTSIDGEFVKINSKFNHIDELILSQNRSVDQVIDRLKESDLKQDMIRDGQDKLFETQKNFISQLWKAFFTILAIITSAGTGVGALIMSIMDK